jgi:hypothetical protein
MIYSSAMKIEVVGSLNMLAPVYQTTHHHIPENNNLNMKVIFIILLHTLAVTTINPVLPIIIFVLP